MRNNITKHIEIKAEYYETRYSWGHKAWIYRDGEEIGYRKITYSNRTWESYEFETILKSLYAQAEDQKLLSKYELRKFKKMIDNGGRVEAERIDAQMKTVAMVAGLGAIFGSSQKESNDWKARMLKAGLAGLEMPEDWESLSEDEKQTRLDAVINQMKGNK